LASAAAAAAATAAATAATAAATATAAISVSFLIVVVADSWSLACCWAAVSFSQFTFAYLLNSLRLGVYLFWLDLFIYSYAAVRVPHEVMPHTHTHTVGGNRIGKAD